MSLELRLVLAVEVVIVYPMSGRAPATFLLPCQGSMSHAGCGADGNASRLVRHPVVLWLLQPLVECCRQRLIALNRQASR
jgi:hypothetical protein